MKRMKFICLVSAILMMVSSLVACGESPAVKETESSQKTSQPEQVEKKEKITINLWYLWTDDVSKDPNAVDMQRIVKEWNEKNGAEIEVRSLANATADKQLAAIAAGEGPDIGHSSWPNAAIWGKEGAMEPLDKYIDADASFDKNDFLKATWKQGQYRGKQYIIPFKVMTMIMYYNMDKLKEAGITKVPETIEELVDAAIKTTKFDSNGNITQLGFKVDYPWRDDIAWTLAFGAKWVDEKGNCTFDTPEMAAAYQWMADYNKKIGVDKMNKFQSGFGEGPKEGFESGKLVMMLSGDWKLNTFKVDCPQINYSVGFAPPPAAKKAELSGTGLVSMAGWYINANSKHKEEAWKFLSYMAGKEQMANIAKDESPDLSARISAMIAFSENPNIVPMQKEVANMFIKDKLGSFPTVSYINDYLGEIATKMTEAVEGRMEVKDALKAVQASIAPKAKTESLGNSVK